jgi:hypothetical protein
MASWLAQANVTEGIWMGLGQAPAGRLRWSAAQVGAVYAVVPAAGSALLLPDASQP